MTGQRYKLAAIIFVKMAELLLRFSAFIPIKPDVYLTVTIAIIAEKSDSDQMNTSLLTIQTSVVIVTIAIAGIGSGFIPGIASAIVTIVNDGNDHMDTGQRS